ncbi:MULTISPECIES: hypothetical protein [Psychrilyobacter]|uniref:Uncharacterized protein n=1 Tax=Psychrilyobacter piezotolerans TaxID=2293438 RepID=A0ABX9KE88_9FUSO|nr:MULTISPECIES: hypothetical protein [Psychrilyobacter]MCS5422020.1 hypothetical protein [Psychrilyobacter sp. S5]NDI78919.1 hypothetical protein [Psychrilyobacter piezotolerans]RDE59312.1 hypothetical protein DV867_13165 [Psychrilyobacter sp. S5]REI39842.1 hypothetical protein DYH56_13165 [Psychrilyobacter piezotolerans]
MNLKIKDIKKLLHDQNYLEFDRLLTTIEKNLEKKTIVYILDDEGSTLNIIHTFEELEKFKKLMIQVYGIYGYF